MTIFYHTHIFKLEPATKEEVKEGVLDGKALAPISVGSAAAYEVEHFATAAQGKKADNAVAKRDIGALAYKDKVTVHDIETSGNPNEDTFLTGAGWMSPSSLEIGDMKEAIYDPNNVRSNAFSMENMQEGNKHLILTPQERAQIAKIDKIEEIAQYAQKIAQQGLNAATEAKETAHVALSTAKDAQDIAKSVEENSLVQVV